MSTDEPTHGDRIDDLRQQYQRDRAAFEPPTDPPAPDEAMGYLREGLGPTVMVYVDARTNHWVRFSEPEFAALHETLNGYLELYTECYGVEMDADFAIRKAAELLMDTHNIRDVAAMLTQVPARATHPR
jgi:hypothetical protein